MDLKLAGGSTPSTAGLNWLADKGYKTLVDLREPSETDAAFIAEVTRRGLRYIALPINLKSVDKAHASRFNFELALSDARPLYFFDADGTRAGALWYIRRITLDRVNSQIARREAEELGLNSPDYWLAATRYVEQVESPRTQVSEISGPTGPAHRRRPPDPQPLHRQYQVHEAKELQLPWLFPTHPARCLPRRLTLETPLASLTEPAQRS